MSKSNVSRYSRKSALIVLAVAAPLKAFAAEQPTMNLDDQEQLEVQSDLFWLTIVMWTLVIGIVIFAYSIRYIAKRTTRPCHWCSEFISNKASVCPRCGKKIAEVPARIPALLK